MLFLTLFACKDDSTDTSAPDDTGGCELATWYADADGDGFGGPLTVEACEAPAGFLDQSTDCDDLDATSHPEAEELCDGADNDCDGELDEDAGDLSSFYADADADGFGDPGAESLACAAPEGTVSDASDCDDGDASVYPGALEVCGDGHLNDCDGSLEEALAECRLERSYTLAWASSTLAGNPGEEFGWALSTSIQADGTEGLVVGAYQADGGAGRVEVGGFSLFGEANSYAGSAVATGDLDGDGSSDVIVGARRYDNNRGAVYAVSSPTGDVSLSDGLLGDNPDDRMGFAVSSGDVDGDGVDDLIASAVRDDTNASNAGAVYVWLGPVSGSPTKLPGPATTDGFAGYSLATGDTDGDGVAEILSGSTGDDTDGNNGGAVFVSAWGDAALADGTIHTGLGQFGRSVAAGDLDGDGIDEVIVGADGRDEVVVVGLATLSGPDGFGRFVGSWDADGDGVGDLFVGSTESGTMSLWYGPVSGTLDTPDALIEDAAGAANGIGRSATVVDGTIALGGSRNDDNGDNAGAVYLFEGYGL